MHEDLTSAIERNLPLEEHFGIRVEGPFAQLTRDPGVGSGHAHLTVNAEIHAADGATIFQDVRMFASAHDASGRVLGVWTTDISSESLVGMQAISIKEYVDIAHLEIARIKLYPQRA